MAIVVELATAPARSIHTKPRGPAWRPTRRLGVSENDWREIEEVSWWQTLFHIKNGGPTGLIGPDWFGLSKLNDAYCVTARFIFAEIKWCTSWTEIKWCYSAFKLYCDVIVMNSKQCACYSYFNLQERIIDDQIRCKHAASYYFSKWYAEGRGRNGMLSSHSVRALMHGWLRPARSVRWMDWMTLLPFGVSVLAWGVSFVFPRRNASRRCIVPGYMCFLFGLEAKTKRLGRPAFCNRYACCRHRRSASFRNWDVRCSSQFLDSQLNKSLNFIPTSTLIPQLSNRLCFNSSRFSCIVGSKHIHDMSAAGILDEFKN